MALPSGYRGLEYIQSTGTQYVDTGFKPNQDSCAVVDYQSDANEGNLFGCDAGWTVAAFDVWVHAVVFSSTYTPLTATHTRAVAKLDKGVFTRDGATLATMTGSFQSSYNLTIFGLNRSGSIAEMVPAKLYSCQVYDNGTIVRDFIPCANASGEIGLWDNVGSKFYANAGTGSFVAGPYTVIKTGDILNYAYTGAVQTVELPKGRYKLEVWGAQGGYRSSATYGGKGGYSVGTLDIDTALLLYLYVGGSGNTGGTSGGFNGGGKRATYPGGGGATDIRLGQDSLLARVLVAAGGGSDGASSRSGAYGGGETGGTASSGYGSGGGGGTQTAGGTGGSSNAGTFGQGGEGKYRSSGYGGAGGGGWYGGGGTYPDGSGDDDKGGGGGSGWVWTGSSAPSGWLLTATQQLTDAATTAGNVSFTGPTGTSETGHSGDGYARITALEVYPLTPDAPENFRQTAKDYFSLSLAWDAAEGATSYKLYRDGALLATLTGTTYTDTDVSPNSSYVYTVSGVNSEGEGTPAQLTASTAEGYVVQIIEISGAVLTPNPADINSKVKLAVSVSETIKILEPYYYHSGDLYAGEV